jgi:cell division protein FtsB
VIRLRPTRLLAIGAVALVAFLYWKPLHSYAHTKDQLAARRAQVAALQAEKAKLERKIALAGTTAELTRQARLLGLVKPGERLFVVRGINAWRARNRAR